MKKIIAFVICFALIGAGYAASSLVRISVGSGWQIQACFVQDGPDDVTEVDIYEGEFRQAQVVIPEGHSQFVCMFEPRRR